MANILAELQAAEPNRFMTTPALVWLEASWPVGRALDFALLTNAAQMTAALTIMRPGRIADIRAAFFRRDVP